MCVGLCCLCVYPSVATDMRSGAGDMLTFGGARNVALHGAPGPKATKSIYEFSFHPLHPAGAHPLAAHTGGAAHTAAGEAASEGAA